MPRETSEGDLRRGRPGLVAELAAHRPCAWPGFLQLLRAPYIIVFVSVLHLRRVVTLGCSVQAVAAQDSRLSLADFLCARPGCAQLLREPVVLNCGCCVCLACRPPLDGQCPRCGAISVTTPVVCSKVCIASSIPSSCIPMGVLRKGVPCSPLSAEYRQPRDGALSRCGEGTPAYW